MSNTSEAEINALLASGSFDEQWYLEQYPDVKLLGMGAAEHYLWIGAKLGRRPSATSDGAGVVAHNPALAEPEQEITASGLPRETRIVAQSLAAREDTFNGAAEGRGGDIPFGPSRSYPIHEGALSLARILTLVPEAIRFSDGVARLAGTTLRILRREGLRGLTHRMHLLNQRRQASDGASNVSRQSTQALAISRLLEPAGLYLDLASHCRLLESSGLIDAEYYRVAAGLDRDANASMHYLTEGWRKGLEPNSEFDGDFLYPYFRSIGFDAPPAITYLRLRAAGRVVYSTQEEVKRIAAIIETSSLFDVAAYKRRFCDDGLVPLYHYIIVGEMAGNAPSEDFDPIYYRTRYPDLTGSKVNLLAHYIRHGRREKRRPFSIARRLPLDRSRIDPRQRTVLIASHQASRTGAPILAYNIASHLRHRYNVVVLLLSGGELVEAFEKLCNAVIGPLNYDDWHPADAEYVAQQVLETYEIAYALFNSIETRIFSSPFANHLVPIVTLVHEFPVYTKPKGSMGSALDSSTEIVFSANITADAAKRDHPNLLRRALHILPQGRCLLPQVGVQRLNVEDAQKLGEAVRPKDAKDALVVLGCGTIFARKAVDIFISCAAAVARLKTKRAVRFVWIGNYASDTDPNYSIYLAEQIRRSGVDDKVIILNEVADLGPAYVQADVFFLSSRLDPLPNVAIDAAFHGKPIVCFQNASGIASLLELNASLRHCVVPYLDANGAAHVIANFANDEAALRHAGKTTRGFAEATFDMHRYVDRLDEIGQHAMSITRQRIDDFETVRNDSLFDERIFLPLSTTTTNRDDAIRHFLIHWASTTLNREPAKNFYLRRPFAGFHPQIYAHENSAQYDVAIVNPLAHFIRSGKPEGPWCHEVITPSSFGDKSQPVTKLRAALHAHFYYPELAHEFLERISANRSRCDVLISTNSDTKGKELRKTVAAYDHGHIAIRVVPNRGRDIGPFLTAFENDIANYEIIGHLHSKRSLFTDPTMGETWREFLWQNLLGDLYPMMDLILERFATDDKLGLVFPEDPHLPDWDKNFALAQKLAVRMGIHEPLPPFFNFPVGTMFWARTKALRPLFALNLDWEDYPSEPVPIDGTMLHALERLLPFAAKHAGYRYATTHIPGVTW